MSVRPKRGQGSTSNALAGEIRGIVSGPEAVTVTVRLRNDGDRALHFIEELRTLRYDAAQQSLAIGLSDAGCTLGPTPMPLPRFGMIDPQSDLEFELTLPPRIVRFASVLSPEGFPTFEQHALSDARTFALEIAWADVPFYRDPRPKSADKMPTEFWAQGKLVLSHELKPAARRAKRKQDG